MILGGKCVCCGEAQQRFLSVDHINGGGAAERKQMGTGYMGKILKSGVPKDKYQLLCMNCNHGRAFNEGVCPHKNPPPTIYALLKRDQFVLTEDMAITGRELW